MQAFVDRFRYKASKARQAQSRLKAIAELAPIPEVIEAPHVVLRFPEAKLPPPPLLTLERAAAGYGDHVVLDRLDCGSIPTTGSRCSAPTATASRPSRSCSPASSRRSQAGDPGAEAAGRLFRAASDRSAATGGQRAAALARRLPESARSACARASAASA